ncbi:6786_t:CDS:2 [Funneliformis caledonium]|uniref:6786_t:CDS:1 n=1 Tax=Funneliformis caledonium TaxID=1117310 RepID=A0A9N9DGD8_9GLOM|nr:6786_t:CDS:2 [Funneliformis caledonium]
MTGGHVVGLPAGELSLAGKIQIEAFDMQTEGNIITLEQVDVKFNHVAQNRVGELKRAGRVYGIC